MKTLIIVAFLVALGLG